MVVLMSAIETVNHKLSKRKKEVKIKDSKSERYSHKNFQNNKYMMASTQITNTEIFTFIAALVLKLFSRKALFLNLKRQQKLLKSRLLFKKIANFTGELLQNYKQLECELFRVFLKHVKQSIIHAFSICMTVPQKFKNDVRKFLASMYSYILLKRS